ncbi:MAG: response regulator, partial [Methylobacteriaceae bacterium]|nr:response regulator [Methylobacteriaceae bacterium]
MEAVPHILVVDDHRDIRDPLAAYLSKNGYRVTTASRASEAREMLQRHGFDLIVLDIMMPGEDGLSLSRHLRETTCIPIIFLTARADEADRIIGLEMGADDYVVKPFSPRELLARIKTVLRRVNMLPPTSKDAASDPGHKVRFDRFTFDVDRRELIDEKGVSIPLSTSEY